jgi:hypothetical protein
MARTTLNPAAAPGPFGALAALLALATCDAVNGNQFKSTGREVLLAYNPASSPPAVVTVQSRALNGRTGSAVATIAAGAYAVFQMFPTDGWMQSDGYIYVDSSDAAVKLAVVKLP